MAKILITEDIHPSLPEGLIQLGYQCDLDSAITYQQVVSSIADYTGLIVATRIRADKKLIDASKDLKFIARAGSGMENIDIEYARLKNIICINSPEGNANSVGEHACGLLLSMFHNLNKSFLEIKEGKWLMEENRVRELEGRTIGIIGYGNTGRAFAKKLSSFGMNVLAYDKYLGNYGDKYVTESSMNQVFKQAEIISLHVPLTLETFRLVNRDYLQRFDNKIYLINTSRGKVIHHDDLLKEIQSGKMMGAALDVYENEDFENQSETEKDIFSSLLKTKKVIFTPHIAGKSFESKRKIAEILVTKIADLPTLYEK